MLYTYKDTKVYYEIKGDGNVPIVFLHGWGGSTKSFSFITQKLNFSHRAMFIDFPPFGKSDEPTAPFDMFDYANLVKEIIIKEGFENPILVGHSFGGRVAIILASMGIASKLILTSSAGMKPKRGIRYYFKVYKYKLCKKLGIVLNSGSSDYKNLSLVMKQTFINIVNTNLEQYASKINVPTILFWGEKDTETPLYMARKLKKLISDSEIISFKNSGHFAYIDNINTFVAIINKLGE